jgi:hypothetical protein
MTISWHVCFSPTARSPARLPTSRRTCKPPPTRKPARGPAGAPLRIVSSSDQQSSLEVCTRIETRSVNPVFCFLRGEVFRKGPATGLKTGRRNPASPLQSNMGNLCNPPKTEDERPLTNSGPARPVIYLPAERRMRRMRASPRDPVCRVCRRARLPRPPDSPCQVLTKQLTRPSIKATMEWEKRTGKR